MCVCVTPHTHISRILLGNLRPRSVREWPYSDLLTTALPVCLALNALHCNTLSSIDVYVCCDPRCSRQQRSMRRSSTTPSAGRQQRVYCVASAVDSDAAEQCPDTATAAFSSCSSVKFPNVYRLLSILGTLPVTTCESERVFSNARFYHRGVNRGLLKPCFNSIRGLHHRLVLSTGVANPSFTHGYMKANF